MKVSSILLLTLLALQQVSGLKVNKNTMELINNGLKAIVSIRQILSTIKTVNELSAQAFPSLAAANNNNKPRFAFMKLFRKNSKKTTARKAFQSKRNPSVGMIKIGEKPPPGLFPETLPYSVSQLEASPGDPFKVAGNEQQIKTLESHINRYFEANGSTSHRPDSATTTSSPYYYR